MVRFGVIGFGIMGRLYARIIHESPRARLVAVASKSAASLDLARKTYGVPVYDDALQMMDREPLDAVYIATPDFLHTPFAVAALERGIAILLEKPMTTDPNEARQIVEAAQRSSAVGTLRFGNRFAPPFLRLKEALDRGDLGAVVALNARLNDRIYVPTQMISWAANTTPAWFLMSHLLDLAWWLTGLKPLRVAARGVRRVLPALGVDTYDAIQALVEYEGGAIGTFETGWILPNTMPNIVDPKFEVIGSRGAGFVDTHEQMVRLATADTFAFPNTLSVEVAGRLQGYLNHIFNLFLDAVEGLGPNPVPLEDGLLNVRTLVAVHRALETGAWEPVP